MWTLRVADWSQYSGILPNYVPLGPFHVLTTGTFQQNSSPYAYVLDYYIYAGIPEMYMSTLVWSHNEFMARFRTVTLLDRPSSTIRPKLTTYLYNIQSRNELIHRLKLIKELKIRV